MMKSMLLPNRANLLLLASSVTLLLSGYGETPLSYAVSYTLLGVSGAGILLMLYLNAKRGVS